jgi:hypothetical protein
MKITLWILILSLFILLIYTAFFSYPDGIWELLVGSARSGMSFYDLRTLNALPSAISQGIDPYFSNPSDPSGRLLNYPPIWINIVDFFRLGNIGNMNFFGFLLGFLAIISFLLFVKKSNLKPIFVLFVVSHSFLFALERGNIDLLIFSIIVIGVLTTENALVFNLFISIATILKIFPIFGYLVSWKQKIVMLPAVLIIFYILFNFDLIKLLTKNTQEWSTYSYGFMNMILIIERFIGHTLSFNSKFLVVSVFLLSTILLVGLLLTKKFGYFSFPDYSIKDDLSFLVGSQIYVSTYMIGSNWDYRMIFLLLTIPWFVKQKSVISVYSLVLLTIAMNQYHLYRLIGNLGFILNITSKYLLFVILFSILFNYYYVSIKSGILYLNKFK